MQDIPLEQTTKRFQSLPESLQDAIFSEKGTDAVLKSCALRDIPTDKTPLIGQLTNRVLLGYLQPESFAFEIQKETGIDALKATQVAHDIDTEIFSEVRLELKKLYPPTIQTPTVQRPGFSGQESGAGFQDSRFKIQEQKPAPRYIVPIPERFKKPETRNLNLETQNLKPEIQDSGFRIQEKQMPAPSPAKTSPENLAGQAAAQNPAVPSQSAPPNEAKSYKLKASEGPPMDPVVPLPTFIQSKFTNTPSPEARDLKSDAQDSSKNDALKNAFGKFTVSSTATETTKEPMSPYRETIEEPKKPTEQKPAAKTQGKVIDLSQF